MATNRLGPGVARERHWHKEGEWADVTASRVRFYLVHQRRETLVEDLGPGDLWFAPPDVPHAIKGLAQGTAFVLIFNDGDFSDNGTLLVTERAAPMSRLVLAKSFGVPESAFEGFCRPRSTSSACRFRVRSRR